MRSDRAHRVETNLVVQQEVFERALSSLFNGLKHVDKKFLENLKRVQAEAEADRKKEEHNLHKSLLAIGMVIQQLRFDIKNEDFVKDHDSEYFQRHLISIEENLSTFRSLLSDQLQVLQGEEKDLHQSIESLQQRLNDTSVTPKMSADSFVTSAICDRVKSRTCSHVDYNIHPDVKEFQQYLRNNGGHTGGWDTKDHLLFTRFLQKYRGLDQMTTALLDFMPDKTPEEIAEHETWYHDYLTLKNVYRKALKEWRDEQILQKKKRETVDESAATDPSTSVVSAKIPNHRDPLVKEKIRKWKEEQQNLRQKQLQELQEKKMQELESWRKKVAYFDNQRKMIAERREVQNMTQKNTAPKETDMVGNISIKHIPLKDFWEQDKLYVQRRQSRLQRFSANSHSRSTSQSTVHAERDPSRLLRPTAVWRARVKRSLSLDGSKPRGFQGPLYIADVPHLAIPKWREGLV